VGDGDADDGGWVTDTVSLDRLAAATAAVLEVPLVVASVFDGARQIFVGAHGLIEPLCSTRWTDQSSLMCRSVAEHGRPIVVQDRRRAPPDVVQGWGGFVMAAYACVPLPGGDGTPIGALAAIDSSRRTWRGRDLVVLRAFADATAIAAACATTTIGWPRPRSTTS
jgi:GAF domain-containing protein